MAECSKITSYSLRYLGKTGSNPEIHLKAKLDSGALKFSYCCCCAFEDSFVLMVLLLTFDWILLPRLLAVSSLVIMHYRWFNHV